MVDVVIQERPDSVDALRLRSDLVSEIDQQSAISSLRQGWIFAGQNARLEIESRLRELGCPDSPSDVDAQQIIEFIWPQLSTVTSASRRSRILASIIRVGGIEKVADLLERSDSPPVSESLVTKLTRELYRQGEIERPLRIAIEQRSAQRTSAFDGFIAARRRQTEILESGFDCSLPTFSARPGTSVWSLYLLHNSLPLNSGGYATRTHGILRALNHLGRPSIGVTRPGFPPPSAGPGQNRKITPIDVVDSITYRRLLGPIEAPPGVDLAAYTHTFSKYLRPVIDEYRPRVLHAASNWWTGVPTTRIAAASGLPSVYEVRGLWEITRASREPAWADSEAFRLAATLETDAARSADRVITITGALRDELTRRGVDREKITVVPNAVDVNRFNKIARDPVLADRLGLSGRVVIGFVGTLTNYEGLDDLMAVCAEIRGSCRPFSILIVGDGPMRTDLEELAKHLAIDDLCRFVGRVPHDQVENYLGLIDITPFPRKSLPVCEMVSPLKPLESMASRIPILASDVAALSEMTGHGSHGLLFKKGDNQDFARQLSTMIDDPDLRTEIAHRARQWVARERDWAYVVQKIVAIYDDLAPLT